MRQAVWAALCMGQGFGSVAVVAPRYAMRAKWMNMPLCSSMCRNKYFLVKEDPSNRSAATLQRLGVPSRRQRFTEMSKQMH